MHSRLLLFFIAAVLVGCSTTTYNVYEEHARACRVNLKIFPSPVSIPHQVLGPITKDAVSLFGSSPRFFATRDVCEKWPHADAIMNYYDEADGNRFHYSGIAIKFDKQYP